MTRIARRLRYVIVGTMATCLLGGPLLREAAAWKPLSHASIAWRAVTDLSVIEITTLLLGAAGPRDAARRIKE